MDLQLTAKTVNQQRDRRLPPGGWSRLRRAGAPLLRCGRWSGWVTRSRPGAASLLPFTSTGRRAGTALNNGGPVDGGAAAFIAFIAVIAGLVGLAIALAPLRDESHVVLLLLLTRARATLLLFGVAIAAIRLAAGTDDS